MTEPPRIPTVVRPLLFIVPALVGLALLPGCETDSYSDAVQYGIRTDPIITESFQGEHDEPDRPGQLPLLAMADLPKIADLFPKGSTEGVQNKLLDPTNISDQDRQAFQDGLNKMFGSPAHPQLNVKGSEGLKKLLRVGKHKLEDTLAHGSRVYRIQCQMCHGVSGDGRGPTGSWVNPHPRDYRQGLFKFQSVDQTNGATRKPLVADLVRTVHNGLEGTAMPAFNMQPQEDIEAVARYVVVLSIRGETEMQTFKRLTTDKAGMLTAKGLSGGIRGELRSWAVAIAGQWEEAQDKAIPDARYPDYSDQEMKESVLRGQAIFQADKAALQKVFPKVTDAEMAKLSGASCTSCHIDYGRQAKFKFDDWGTLVRPANLTTGVYRGGRRPIDLYWRIHSGINGSGMNRFGDVLLVENSKVLNGDRIWDLVNFVRALPYPAMRKNAGIEIH